MRSRLWLGQEIGHNGGFGQALSRRETKRVTILKQSEGNMALDEEAMQGRVYVHKKCGGETRIAEGDFMEICNPMCFVPLRGTLCVVCNAPDKLTEFEWADTSETLTDFRTRMSALVSPFWRTLMAWAWIPAGLIIGGAIGAIVASEKGHAGACFLAGAFGGILLLWQLLDANTVAAWLKLKFHHQK